MYIVYICNIDQINQKYLYVYSISLISAEIKWKATF